MVEVAPYWNVNDGMLEKVKKEALGRSSSILECKSVSTKLVLLFYKTITSWANLSFCSTKVEVAPYWNVNMSGVLNLYVVLVVEVAPYWNVNHN